jgi:DNA (cytosine-5)-methyltransferase 1
MKVCSLFAGIGGICLGFKQAGFEIVWANEYDSAACKTYRHNFGNSYLVEADIRDIKASNIPDFDVLVAGFPCQPFSIAGRQKGFNDKRGNLFFEITRIIDAKRPKVIFLENVANLVEHDEGRTFLVIYNSLAQFGYTIYYKVMAGNDYGNLPQIRKRIYIVAIRDDIANNMYHHPEPVELTLKSWDIIHREEKQNDIYYYNDTELFAYLTSKMNDKRAIYRITDTDVRWTKNNMCPTLTANMGTYPDRVPVVWDNFGIRKLTLRECLDFQGFPKEFYFPNTITIEDAYKQIGNSVCVPVVKRIAEQIKVCCGKST